ncbi:MAG: penicillin-binding protein 2 [Bacillota bacterium]
MSQGKIENRIAVFVLLVLVGFALLAGRMAQLQLVQGAEYNRLADGNRRRIELLRAPRGIIFDREGRVLATNRPAFTVSLVRMGASSPDPEVLRRLASILDIAPSEMEERVTRGASVPLYQPLRIKRDVSPEVYTIIDENSHELPGVILEVEPMREYPFHNLASHVLGYLREIDDVELARLSEQGYRMGDMVGKAGVEALYDLELHGTHGGRQVEVDARGRRIKTLPRQVDPVPGNSLVLTIDAHLQDVAEKALLEQMKILREDPLMPQERVGAGAAVVLDVKTGEVLAMASIPDYDPNLFAGEISLEAWLTLEQNPLFPFSNRAITAEYAPGSTFKMVTAIAALETGRIHPRETFYDPGVYWRVMPKTCWERRGHGTLSLEQAIAQSCNVAFYEIGYRTGIDSIARYAAKLGLGEPTGIQFVPRENLGLVPSTAWKKQAFEEGLPGIRDPRWYDAETLDASIGQGFHRYTPLQMAVYASALATGQRLQPQVVKEVLDPGGTPVRQLEPKVVGTVGVASAHLDAIRNGMLKVTQPGGTAGHLFTDLPIAVAGKTGTVEMDARLGRDDHGWFVGYAPFADPQVAVAVIVEEGGGGSRAAAPVAKKILQAYFGFPVEIPAREELEGS